jgi:hypothetical protein
MTDRHRVVFLLDVDNTLLDNDRVAGDLRRYLDREVGPERGGRYWEICKERELDEVERLYPAEHYVLVDDKLRILTAVKQAWGARVTTVFPRHSHYASAPKILAAYPPADLAVDRVGDLLAFESGALVAVARDRAQRTNR